jgi:Family of unknown function (DUF5985)
MEKVVYTMCALAAALCAFLLLSNYRRTRFRLLMWSGACFVGLTVHNVLLVLDRLIFTNVDLSSLRLGVALVALLLLLCGLILESDS